MRGGIRALVMIAKKRLFWGFCLADNIIYLENPNTGFIHGTHGRLSEYKININKTQILAFNYSPSQDIKKTFQLKWDAKTKKYLGVALTK